MKMQNQIAAKITLAAFLPILIACYHNEVMAQTPMMQPYQEIMFRCLLEQFPEIRIGLNGDTAYDPVSRRNFFWNEKQNSWIDAKTGLPAGACIARR